MSYLGAPPTAPLAPPPQGEPGSEIPGWAVGAAVVVALAMLASLVFVLVNPSHPPEAKAAPPAGPSYPAHWDPRIAPYAKIAAKERGLRFLHPVPVRFMSPRTFGRSLWTEDGDLSKKDRAQLAASTAQLRALGLIGGDVDLLDATNDSSSGAVVGYYSFKTQRISVRGHTITPAVKETLVHELTHVLQDQHFHVGDRMRKLDRESETDTDDAAGTVYRAIVEGDAERVQHKYDASLGPRQRRALAASQRTQIAGAERRTARVPSAVTALMDEPYALGEPLVDAVQANLGNWAVNRLFRHPPTHESALLDPFRLFSHTTETSKVAVPRLNAGETLQQSGEFGAVALYLMLAKRLPETQALAAADAWAGDAMVAYRRGGTTCVRATFAPRTAAGASVMESALQQWRADGSEASANVSRTGALVHLQTCDPGQATYVGSSDSDAALQLPATRAALGTALLRNGTTAGMARCVAGHSVDDFTLAELTDPNFGADPAKRARMQQIAAECY